MLQSLPRPGFWMAVALAAIGVGLQIMLATPFGVLDIIVEQGFHQKPPRLANEPVVIGIINIMAFGGTVALGLFLNRLSPRQAFPLSGITVGRVVGVALLVLGLCVLLSDVDNLFRWIFPVPRFLQETFQQLFFEEGGLGTKIFLLVIVAPVAEELLFRGIILRGLLSRFRPFSAILLSSLLFAAVHLNPWQLVSATVLGMAFGWFYV